MTDIKGALPPPVLEYGHQPGRVRQWWRWLLIVTLLAVVLAGGWLAWTRVSRWINVYTYNREAAAWYARAANHIPPADELRYTENPADAPKGGFLNGFAGYGDPTIDRIPAFTKHGPILSDQTQLARGHLFTGERTTSAGYVRLLVVTTSFRGVWQTSAGGTTLGVYVNQIGPMPGAAWNETNIRTLRAGSCDVDLTGVCGPGELRLYAGQPDSEDPARFSIPFEARGRRGWIDGHFVAGRTFSGNPRHRQREMEANSRVEWSVRFAEAPATRPAGTVGRS